MPTDLIDLKKLDPTLKFDIRYARTDNFVNLVVYPYAGAYLLRHVAKDLLIAHHSLMKKGYGLLIYDGYRPWSVTKIFWDRIPPDKREFVADPEKGSVHNRGCAVDLSIYHLKSNQPVEMPSDFDEMTERAYLNYCGGSVESRRARDLLREEMHGAGFHGIKNEWWHFNHSSWMQHPILDLSFEELAKNE